MPVNSLVVPVVVCVYYGVMKSSKPRIHGIGNPLMDIIVEVSEDDLDALGIHKGTMHLIDIEQRSRLLTYLGGKERTYSCGGSCPNTIIALASLGLDTTLAGMVGNDEFGEIYRKNLESLGVASELGSCDTPTGSSIILLTPDSERTMNTYLGANRAYRADLVSPRSLQLADVFHFTGYMWDTPNQKDAVLLALDLSRSYGTLVSFDVADPFAVARNRDAFLGIIANRADIVFANSEEARILFNNYDAFECCRSMGKLCRIAVVKNGKQGSFVSIDKEIVRIPVKGPSTPVDTTGAGDVYAAGFLYGIATGLDANAAGAIASYLAGEIIQQRGAQFSKEQADKLKERIGTMQT